MKVVRVALIVGVPIPLKLRGGVTTAEQQITISPHVRDAAASSGGTSGLEGVDIKAIREVQELHKSMKMARLHVSAEVDECSPGESIRQAVESIRKVSVGEVGLLDGGATACVRTAKDHERNMNYLTIQVSQGTLLSIERVSPRVSYTALRKLGYRIILRQYLPETRGRALALMQATHAFPHFSPDLSAASELVQLKELVLEYERASQRIYPREILLSTLLRCTDSNIKEHPYVQMTDGTTYGAVKEYILRHSE